MNLSFKLLGFEVATVSLDFPASEPAATGPISNVTVLDKGMKWMSDKWVKGMMAH